MRSDREGSQRESGSRAERTPPELHEPNLLGECEYCEHEQAESNDNMAPTLPRGMKEQGQLRGVAIVSRGQGTSSTLGVSQVLSNIALREQSPGSRDWKGTLVRK